MEKYDKFFLGQCPCSKTRMLVFIMAQHHKQEQDSCIARVYVPFNKIETPVEFAVSIILMVITVVIVIFRNFKPLAISCLSVA